MLISLPDSPRRIAASVDHDRSDVAIGATWPGIITATGVNYAGTNPRSKRWIPILGRGISMCDKNYRSTLVSLNRIAGQVRGIGQMVEDERYCIDILQQIHAVKAALSRVENAVLRSHAACCVEEAIASGDADRQRSKFNELVEVFAKAKL
ncbi:Copper-sensing transcriptional repressor CsoR [Ensifer sp. M14]|nr:Copper-sensing transcriptional repressor CsoR [Ensifer sp. M14]